MRAWHGIGRAIYTVVVSGGVGYVDGNLTGRIMRVIVTAPSGAPALAVAVTDKNGRCLWADGPRSGSEINFDAQDAPCHGKIRITLSGVSSDGSYTVTCYGMVETGDWLITT